MRAHFFLLLLLLAAASCKKDLIHPRSTTRLDSHTTNRLNRIRFINDSFGICVGGARFDEGNILITRDGGYTWMPVVLPDATKEVFGITTAPDGRVYLTGFDGKLFGTADGGHTWSYKQTRYEVYKAIAFSDRAHAECVGGVSFERGDDERIDTAGNVESHDSLGYELADIYINAATGAGLRSGYGVLQWSSDRGQTWQWTTLNSDFYNTIYTLNGQIAWTCGTEGAVAATYDGGRNWSTLRNGNDLTLPKYHLQDIISTDGFMHGYAAGEKGLVIYTDDEGRHWSELERFTDADLHGVAKCPNGDIVVCGEGGELWRISP